jgi:phosphoribosylaminoimidazolecarboxamide formyltransferase/IMP cyclohydrolase
VTVTDIASVTGFPEIMDGRVKTLHPAVHGGILARRDDQGHMRQAEEAGIPPIDLVAVNLYAFAETVARPGVTCDEAMESTDIGGPAMIRAAAKNHRFVAVVTDPGDYDAVLQEMADNGGTLSLATRERLAAKAFGLTASYDAAIHSWLVGRGDADELPVKLGVFTAEGTKLRYGENPHQRAAFYALPGSGEPEPSVATAQVLNGKELSYNNYLDIDAAFELVKEFAEPAAVVIKHTNPCGAATADSMEQAFRDALAGDPQSAFGGILAFNRPVDAELAGIVANPGCFFEAVIAPGIEDEAVKVFRKKVKWGKSVRLLTAGPLGPVEPDYLLRSVKGGILLQDRDMGFDGEKLEVVTETAPKDDIMRSLIFAWKAVKHVKSNGILLARKTAAGNCVVGVGAGQMSRIDSTGIAGRKAGDRAAGSVMASDAFFPFRDCVDAAADLGILAIIQPGGSVRDKESIEAANEKGLPMVFTGRRHFRH